MAEYLFCNQMMRVRLLLSAPRIWTDARGWIDTIRMLSEWGASIYEQEGGYIYGLSSGGEVWFSRLPWKQEIRRFKSCSLDQI